MLIHIIVSTLVVPPKLQQKVSQRFLVNRGVLYLYHYRRAVLKI